MNARTALGAGICAAALTAGAAHGVVIAGGGGNTNAPADDPGWDHLGSFNTGANSGVYLGNGWILTAYHVFVLDNPTAFNLGGTAYALDTGSWTRLTNATSSADLVMVKLTNATPALSTLQIRASAPVADAAVAMIGHGYYQASDLTYWTNTLPTWTETAASNAVYSGYNTTGTLLMQWGLNNVALRNLNVNDGYGVNRSFTTVFDSNAGPDEAQAVVGDSGGGVFIKNGATWELAGMMYNVDSPYAGEPPSGYGRTAVFGTSTYAADLSAYRSQINSIIPEPSALAVMSGAFLMRWLLGRRRRNAADAAE